MQSQRRKPLAASACLLALTLGGCGNDDETRFGPVNELRNYRSVINPIVDKVSAIEAEVTERAVGTSGAATAENLNTVYREVRPYLLEALVALDRIKPPAELRFLHADIRQLIVLRIDAYALVIEGVTTGNEDLYCLAEEKLFHANKLIPDLNDSLCQVDIALGDAEDCRLLA